MNEWMTQAHCEPNEIWTTETRPPQPVMRLLAKICDGCPVIAECAQYALEHPDETHHAVYAGVYIPGRRTHEWFGARDILHRRTWLRRSAS